jgi:hypothetical protein
MSKNEDPDDLLAGLKELKDEARALGMFTEDRELLACPHCGLKEIVTFEGVLITCRGKKADTGLRFPEPDGSGRSICPGCGGEVC